MINIRSGIFETNSSSTHNLSFRFKKIADNKLEISGEVCTIHGINQIEDFYLNNKIVSGEREKLNYIFTWMHIRDCGGEVCEFEEDEKQPPQDLWWPDGELQTGDYDFQYKKILEAIQRKYPDVKRICFKDSEKSCFDHQTCYYEADSIVDLYSTDEIYDYLFNDHIIIKIDRD